MLGKHFGREMSGGGRPPCLVRTVESPAGGRVNLIYLTQTDSVGPATVPVGVAPSNVPAAALWAQVPCAVQGIRLAGILVAKCADP